MRKEIISIIKEQYWGLINDRQWIQIVLTPVFLIGIIMIVLQKMLFASYGETKVSLFIITIALMWVGIFNSITSICSMKKRIKRQYKEGMSVFAFTVGRLIFELLRCLVQAVLTVIVFSISIKILNITFPSQGILLPFNIEIFFSFYLIITSSDILGLLISSFSSNNEKAMTIMPLFLVIEMIFSNSLFELPAVFGNLLNNLSLLMISRFGIDLLGVSMDMNSMAGAVLEEFPKITFEYSIEHYAFCIFILVCFSLVYALITMLQIKRIGNKDIY